MPRPGCFPNTTPPRRERNPFSQKGREGGRRCTTQSEAEVPPPKGLAGDRLGLRQGSRRLPLQGGVILEGDQQGSLPKNEGPLRGWLDGVQGRVNHGSKGKNDPRGHEERGATKGLAGDRSPLEGESQKPPEEGRLMRWGGAKGWKENGVIPRTPRGCRDSVGVS